MRISPKQYAQSLFESLDGKKDNEAKEIIKTFAQVLVKNNQSSQTEKIISYFVELWDKKNDIVQAEITSAHKLDVNIVKLLEKYIEKASNSKKVEIKQKHSKPKHNME